MINATPIRPLGSDQPSFMTNSPTQAVATPPPPPVGPTMSVPPAGGLPSKAPRKKISFKLVGGLIVLLLVIIGGAAGLYLTQINQDVRQQASTGLYPTPTGAAPSALPSGNPAVICTPQSAGYSAAEGGCVRWTRN